MRYAVCYTILVEYLCAYRVSVEWDYFYNDVKKYFDNLVLGNTQVRAVSRYFVYMKQRENPNGIGGEGSCHTATAATCPRRTGPDPGAAGNKYRCRCNWIAIKIDSSGEKGVKFMNSCSSSSICPDFCHGVEWDRERDKEKERESRGDYGYVGAFKHLPADIVQFFPRILQ